MVSSEDINTALEKMILSASGWRGIFAACGNEEGVTAEISQVHRLFAGAAALVFAEYLQNSRNPGAISPEKVVVLLGCDTRPTGKAIAEAMIPVLLAAGCEVRYSGFTAAPEIMAWARNAGMASSILGFIYISASHNPIGHNGLKFGLTDGGVLAAEEAVKLISGFRSFLDRDDCALKIESLISAACPEKLKNVYANVAAAKAAAYRAYYDFCGDVVWGESAAVSGAIKTGLAERPLGIVCDFNGSARTVSIDRDFFIALGLKFDSINDKPGEIAHRIVPEGESLEPCRELLRKAHERDSSFILGYVPDCDGDRGNLVIWDDVIGKARILEAQEVFALACAAEFSHLVWTGELVYDSDGKLSSKAPQQRAAVAINDPTSLRVDRIAEAFGISVFRAEVGEANVVGLARKLRKEGYIVRILGEGSAGGNITHPSAVRDPINTVLSIVKLLSVRSGVDRDGLAKPGLFEIWCRLSGQMEMYRDDFTLADIITSLPPFLTTGAYTEEAILRINTKDHSLLKDRYQKVFLREWEERREELKLRYGIHNWEASAYNGMEERRGLTRFGDAGKGGLKILFFNGEGRAIAAIWMRGSATEPVFRVMVDVQAAEGGVVQSTTIHTPTDGRPVQAAEGGVVQFERDFIEWQRRMTIEADLGN